MPILRLLGLLPAPIAARAADRGPRHAMCLRVGGRLTRTRIPAAFTASDSVPGNAMGARHALDRQVDAVWLDRGNRPTPRLVEPCSNEALVHGASPNVIVASEFLIFTDG